MCFLSLRSIRHTLPYKLFVSMPSCPYQNNPFSPGYQNKSFLIWERDKRMPAKRELYYTTCSTLLYYVQCLVLCKKTSSPGTHQF